MSRYTMTLQSHLRMQTCPHLGVLLYLNLHEIHRQEIVDLFLNRYLIPCHVHELPTLQMYWSLILEICSKDPNLLVKISLRWSLLLRLRLLRRLIKSTTNSYLPWRAFISSIILMTPLVLEKRLRNYCSNHYLLSIELGSRSVYQ